MATAFLAACIHVAPQPIDPTASARRLEARTLADAESFVAAPGGGTQWDVETLTLAALYFHPELDVARAQAAVARAAIVTAGERPNPTVSLPVEHKSEAHPWITVLGFDVPIETANKRGIRRQRAEELARAADFAVAQDRKSV